ncbi:MAG: adenylate/guanylate cyclase domain-containing protein [Spirochaetia bacterium]
MKNENEEKNLLISNEDLKSVDQYRKSRDTAVLTIMFTDIKGYTSLTEDKGDKYAQDIRQAHDKILTEVIQEDGDGLIVKHIGDAVMAVFSEPTAAVKKALIIQRRISFFNNENPDLDDIKVRIGLHLGQVAVEGEISTDIFGRHVNRASRIENLADGGQIYMSYSVFDSARGWLSGQNSYTWKKHGSYFLKGIPDPVEIFEIADPEYGELKPPQKAKKKKNLPGAAAAAILVAAGVLLTLGIIFGIRMFKKTEVIFANFHPQELYVDHEERIYFDGEQGQELRASVTAIPPGEHVLHYDVSPLVRYYSRVEIKRGENIIEPYYDYYQLPGLEVRMELDGREEAVVNESKTVDYFTYDGKKRIDRKVRFEIEIRSRMDPENKNSIIHTADWITVVDGQEIGSGNIEKPVPIDGDSYWPDLVPFWEDDFHYYWYRPYMNGQVMEMEIGSYFLRYK